MAKGLCCRMSKSSVSFKYLLPLLAVISACAVGERGKPESDTQQAEARAPERRGAVRPTAFSTPHQLCSALERHGIATRGWKTDGIDWSCSSDYQPIGAPGLSLATNVAYYVIGDSARSAHTAKIVLNVNNPRTRSEGLRELADLAFTLFATSALRPPTGFLESVRTGEETSGEVGSMRYSLEREVTRIETLRVVVSGYVDPTRTASTRHIARSEFHPEITRVLAANGVLGCGQYTYEGTDARGVDFLVRCTSDGENWKTYFVSTRYRKATPLDTDLSANTHARRQAWEEEQERGPLPEDLPFEPRPPRAETPPRKPRDANARELSRIIAEQEERQETLRRERSQSRPQLKAWVTSDFLPRVQPVSRTLTTIRAAVGQDFREAEQPCNRLAKEVEQLDASFVGSCPDPTARRALAEYVASVREVAAHCNAGAAIGTMEAVRRSAAAESRLGEALRIDD